MGRSKRERVVALTKTRKRLVGRESKQKLLETIRKQVDDYDNIYLFRTSNMRNTLLKRLREQWRDSRFFLGRQKIAQVAFGRTESEEYADGLSKVAAELKGNVGLLFTNRPHEEVASFFSSYAEEDYARSGFKATETVVLEAGELEMFVPSQEHNLRLLGLPISLEKGKVVIQEKYTVCQKGDVLTPESAKLLEYLGYKFAIFSLTLISHFNKSEGLKQLVSKENVMEA